MQLVVQMQWLGGDFLYSKWSGFTFNAVGGADPMQQWPLEVTFLFEVEWVHLRCILVHVIMAVTTCEVSPGSRVGTDELIRRCGISGALVERSFTLCADCSLNPLQTFGWHSSDRRP